MAYTPINWQNGDTITAEKMNKMDNGWSVTSDSIIYIDNESVTTNDTGQGICAGPTSYLDVITDDSITVVFNGTAYTCTRGAYGYGAVGASPTPDFTTYPFGLVIGLPTVLLLTETAGTYTLTVSGSSTSVEVSEQFQTAVNSSVNTMPMECVSDVTTYQEMLNAYKNGRILFFRPYGDNIVNVGFIAGFDNNSTVSFIPENNNIAVRIDNGIFKVAIN